MAQGSLAPVTAGFVAAELAQYLDRTTPCAPQRCSVRDAGWESVLVRVSQRSDSSGRADMGVLPHPRIMLVSRGRVAIQRRDGLATRSAQLWPGKAWLVPAGESLNYEWARAGGGTREMTVMVLPGAELARTADLFSHRRSSPVTWTKTLLAEDRVVGSVLTGLARGIAAGADDLYAESSAAFLLAHLLSQYGTGAAGPARPRPGGCPCSVGDRIHAGQPSPGPVARRHRRQRRAEPLSLRAGLPRLDGNAATPVPHPVEGRGRTAPPSRR